MPILSGFSNYLWPLVLGSRDMAFPRLNALSYWVYLALVLFMYAGFAVGAGPNDGWFNYVPNASRAYNPGINMDFYAFGMIFLGISTTVGSANFIVTFLRTRAPGMSINRVPILIWGTLTASGSSSGRAGREPRVLPVVDGPPIRHAFLRRVRGRPAIVVAASVLDVRPSVGLRRRAAGDGHGLLPSAAARRLRAGGALDGRDHDARLRRVGAPHVRTGLPGLALSFSGASIVTVPSAVAVFAWTATIWLGRPVVTTAFLYFSSMIVLFVIGGVSGFMTASVPVDWQLTDTYFVVAHLHYVLINLFPVLGGLYIGFRR